MRHQVFGKKLSRTEAERAMLIKSLANHLILQERILTTRAKAQVLKPFVERLVTRAKDANLSDKRLLYARLGSKKSVKKLVNDLAPRFKDRNGGTTRVVLKGPRRGDAAPMVYIEWVVQKEIKKVAKPESKTTVKITDTKTGETTEEVITGSEKTKKEKVVIKQ
ncbi:50S ribosomal protein L17 [Candidatus Curtissbacteria bacterium]|nr:50S ribosomal protein L17 [Candidatus Curtissbacteria bacterium]